jgi:hypothetical protein
MQSPSANKPRLKSLEYAPLTRHSVRWRRRLVVALSMAILAPALARFAPVGLHRTRVFLLQRECASYHASGDSPVNGVVPACWAAFYARLSPPGNVSRGTVLLHELRTPRGERRLVAIDAARRCGELNAAIMLLPRVFELGTPLRLPREVLSGSDAIALDDAVVMYAAQTDPQDRSHFTFHYEIDGREHVVDGWLDEGDRVTMQEQKDVISTMTQPELRADAPPHQLASTVAQSPR